MSAFVRLAPVIGVDLHSVDDEFPLRVFVTDVVFESVGLVLLHLLEVVDR